jgi:histidinol dehydrogenase
VFAAAGSRVAEAYVVGGAQRCGVTPVLRQFAGRQDRRANAYVAAAKQAVFRHVRIDTIAGLEITVIADRDNVRNGSPTCFAGGR